MIWTILKASALVWAIAVITAGGMKRVTPHDQIALFVTTFTVFMASYILSQGTGILGFLIIFTSPIWFAVLLVFIIKITVGNIELALAKSGFLGTRKKWMYQLHTNKDREYEAAKTLLPKEKKDKIQEVSANKKDYRDNIVQAAGLDENTEKSVDEVLRSE